MRDAEPEDEILGRAYDARVMRRVWSFTRPHIRLVLVTCGLFPAVSLIELAQPYPVLCPKVGAQHRLGRS